MRKSVDGEIRNKERTKEKLIEAVGEILINEGYTKLGINNIARKALVDKQLIYRYFGGIDELLASYFRKRDFWTQLSEGAFENIDLSFQDNGKKLASEFLIHLFDNLYNFEEARKILIWEISEKSEHLKKLSIERELLGKDLFAQTDEYFKDTNINLRACYAILLSGVYYLTLHSKSIGGEFCEIDINTENGQKEMKKAIFDIIEMIFNSPNK
ncbi:TetR/AcrR family transcriptional regulator [Sphingobacterium composti Ten et al. 2007 non Yoo et al. 2007]|uniref:TetR/AcrR family transcriptional regulator n=1 Tax=Sphingobacterium composti TaxID=363260 RepID=UPI00135BBF50|nr:TetR/AcrR family transcriptional regulator [Sphingobacterium composti Ten et al. 2007 non Yoo et al. 2007]